MKPLTEQSVLIFVGDDYEDMELQYPKYRLREAGCKVVLAGLEAGHTYKGKYSYPQTSDMDVVDVEPADFDALVIPGGWMPDKLRRYDAVKRITKTMADSDKPICSICHGPWIDISADIVKGMTYTSTPGIKDDLINAGATWVDQEVCVDGNRVTSRRPDDLPAFMDAFLKVMTG